jgi:hypothetical protein
MADLPTRLVEIGSSAGLNLRADRFHITGEGASYGDPASPVQLLDAWRLALTAYVWADELQRLRSVQQLTLSPGRWTVLWHSVFRQYLTDPDHDALSAAIGAVAAAATADAPFAHVWLEPASRSGDGDVEIVLTAWPGGGEQRVLGVAAAHGIPATWRDWQNLQPNAVS